MASDLHSTSTLPLGDTVISPPVIFQEPPSLEEIHRAIPPQGIKIGDFTELFKSRIPGQESFRTLLLLASAVARFDSRRLMMWPKSRPTKEEVRAAIQQNGIHFADFVNLFKWNYIPEVRRRRLAHTLHQIAVPDMATHTIRPRGNVTAAEVIASIPDEGITHHELSRKIKAFSGQGNPGEFWQAMEILSQVAVWDVFSERIFKRDGTAVSPDPSSKYYLVK